MRRARVCAGMGLGFMLASSLTQAGQLDLSLENRLGGDSNVFRRAVKRDAKPDGTYEIAPRLAIRDDSRAVNYAFDYRPVYRQYFDVNHETSSINGTDHSANGRVAWAVNPTNRFSANVSYFNGRQYLFGRGLPNTASTFNVNDRERTRIADATLDYTHQFSPALSFGLSASLDDYDVSGTNAASQVDSRAYTGSANFGYELDEITEVGMIVQTRHRENLPVRFDKAIAPTRPTSHTDIWDVMLTGSRRFSPTFSVSGRIGPSFIRQQQIPSGAVNPFTNTAFQHDESSAVTLFAAASVRKSWKKSNLSASYVRSETRSGTTSSSSSISDRVTIEARRSLSDRLALSALGGWDRLDQIFNKQGGAGSSVITLWRTTESVEFTLTRNWHLTAQYTFMHQVSDSSGLTPAPPVFQTAVNSDVNVHLGFVGVRYSFETLSF